MDWNKYVDEDEETETPAKGLNGWDPEMMNCNHFNSAYNQPQGGEGEDEDDSEEDERLEDLDQDISPETKNE